MEQELLCAQSIFKQIVKTADRLDAFANRHLFAPMGLSSASLKILHTLSIHPVMTPSRLMSELSCTKSNITQRLDLLEKNGLVHRTHKANGKDRRTVGISLTELGKRKISDTIKILREKGSVLENRFGNEEKKNCAAFMTKVNLILDHYEHDRPTPHAR